jgi:predicted transcriptional regulator
LSERNILTLYNAGNYLKVVRAIADSPEMAKEITSATNMQEVTIADMLENLEKQRAVEYVDAKWKLTEIGKAVLVKFF